MRLINQLLLNGVLNVVADSLHRNDPIAALVIIIGGDACTLQRFDQDVVISPIPSTWLRAFPSAETANSVA